VPQYPRFLVFTAATLRRDLGTIEVTIDERGNVEAVKLMNEPQSIGEYLLEATSLSAVKSWRFLPASKDGHAVRYRAQVVIGTW
jgi:TonB family protein